MDGRAIKNKPSIWKLRAITPSRRGRAAPIMFRRADACRFAQRTITPHFAGRETRFFSQLVLKDRLFDQRDASLECTRMNSGCFNGCRDPTWGGEGTCDTSSDPPVCLCEDGFASQDAMGYASCVPRRMLVAGYVVLAVASSLTTAVLMWQANKFRYLPAGMVASPGRTSARLRALVCSRYCCRLPSLCCSFL